MWWIAVRTLVADRGKLFTALVGVVFSIVLCNIQGGLFLGLINKASLLVDHGHADVWVGHRMIHNVDLPSDVPRRWIERIRAVPGVQRAAPYLIGVGELKLPSGGFEGVVVVGVDRSSLLGGPWNLVAGPPDSLSLTDAIVIDDCEMEKLENPRLGDSIELGGYRARIAGMTHGIAGFLVMPYVFTTHERAAVFLQKRPDVTSYFLVQLVPGADARQVCLAIKQRLPDADAYPRDEYSRITVNYWMTRTGLGISFGASTFLGLLVGMVMVGQTLYALVLDRLGEFGTLKAIGATERQVYSVLFVQAIFMAIVGSVVGLLLAGVIQHACDTPKAPIVIPWWLSLGSCLVVAMICLISSGLPYVRLRGVDPLTVLQS